MNPDALSFLRRHYAELGPFQVEFRLRTEDDWPLTLDYWFGAPGWRDGGHNFDLVGVDATGGLYCLWRYPELGDRAPPVVFLGSEGDGIAVIAGDAASLVEALAQGYWWFASLGRFSRDEENLLQPAFDAFREQAAAFLARPLRSPESIVEAGQAQHPNFAAFVARTLEHCATATAGDADGDGGEDQSNNGEDDEE